MRSYAASRLGNAVPTTIVAAWAAQIESLADRLERVIR